jgi:hypothetical protein
MLVFFFDIIGIGGWSAGCDCPPASGSFFCLLSCSHMPSPPPPSAALPLSLLFVLLLLRFLLHFFPFLFLLLRLLPPHSTFLSSRSSPLLLSFSFPSPLEAFLHLSSVLLSHQISSPFLFFFFIPIPHHPSPRSLVSSAHSVLLYAVGRQPRNQQCLGRGADP